MIGKETSDLLKQGTVVPELAYIAQRTEDGKLILVPCGAGNPAPCGTVAFIPFVTCGSIVAGTPVAGGSSNPTVAGLVNLVFGGGATSVPGGGANPIPAVFANPIPSVLPTPIPAVNPENTATLMGYAEKWLDNTRLRVKDSTYNKYWNAIHSYVMPELGELQWNDVDREKVETFCRKMLKSGGKKGQGLSSGTVNDILTVLRRVLRYAKEHGVDVSFDISSVTVKKEQKEKKVLTLGDQKKLCRYLRIHLSDRNIGLLICIYTGLRVGEICGLKWEDISFSDKMITVRRAVQRIQVKDDPDRKTKVVITDPKSASSVRTIPIPKALLKILREYGRDKSGFILTGSQEMPMEPRAMERHLEKVLQEVGIEHVNFHALRHTFATRCVELGFDIKSLSEILGHSSVNITLNRYVHPSMDLKRRNMEKYSTALDSGDGDGNGDAPVD